MPTLGSLEVSDGPLAGEAGGSSRASHHQDHHSLPAAGRHQTAAKWEEKSCTDAAFSRSPFRRGLWALQRRLRGLMAPVEETPAIRAAKRQSRPCGAQRFLLLGVYFCYALLTARVYFAWPNLSNLLFRSGAYSWLCDPKEPDLRLPENGGKRYMCEAQNSEVGKLFVTCLAFAFSCSLMAGVCLDFLGAKLTAMLGQLCNALAWLLLAFAGKGCETYFAAFILMGVGSDVGYLPLLSSANLFPGHEGLVIALLGAAKSASFAMPTILDATEYAYESVHLKEVSLGYAVFGPGLCFLLAGVLVPMHVFKPWNEFVSLEEETGQHPLVRVNDSFASYGAHVWRESFSNFQDVKDWLHHHHVSEDGVGGASSASAAAALTAPSGAAGPGRASGAPVILSPVSMSPALAPGEAVAPESAAGAAAAAAAVASGGNVHGVALEAKAPILEKATSADSAATTQVLSTALSTDEGFRRGPTADEIGGRAADPPMLMPAAAAAAAATPPTLVAAPLPPIPVSQTGSVRGESVAGFVEAVAQSQASVEAEKPPTFWSQVLSKFAFGIIVYSVLKAIMYAFFTTAAEDLLGKEVNDFMGAFLPFSCIPCLVLGKLVDSFGIMPVLLVLNSFITLAYGFSMIGATGTAYVAALLYICYVSFYSSQSYCYVSDTFSSCHFGKLVGIIHMIAGFLSLLKIPMQSLVVNVFNSNYTYPCVILLGFCFCNYLILLWLFYLKKKNPHPYWPASAREAVEKEQQRVADCKRRAKNLRKEGLREVPREGSGIP